MNIENEDNVEVEVPAEEPKTKREVTLSTGRKIIIPIITEKDVKPGWVRKIRHLSEQEQQAELTWLLLESKLSEDELDVLDDLGQDEFTEAMEALNEGDPKE